MTPRSRGLRALIAVAVFVSAAATVLAAVFAGWKLHNANPGRPLAISVNRPVHVVSDAVYGSHTVPNVLGLDAGTARTAMLDAGIPAEGLSQRRVPYAGQPGVVVGQEPQPGKPRPKIEILSVASRAPMPRLLGESTDAARRILAGYGVRVITRSQYVPGKAEDVVLKSDPPAGATLAANATLTVSEPPSSVFLEQLAPIASDCSAGDSNIDARSYQHSVTCDASRGAPAIATYLLDRRVRDFAAVVGLDDHSAPGIVRFTVLVDGHVAARRQVSLGQVRRIHVTVANALRLQLVARVVAGGRDGDVKPSWGTAKLVGGESAIDAVVKASPP